jgi:diaminohydroxyphosphoribosylaminopyrimidine deaminase/5-amino-6-(5-phosphoribosylamino)uracil reductase
MRLAVDEAKQSVSEERAGRFPVPVVGAVLARGGEVLATAHRGESGEGDHAEFVLLKRKLKGIDLSGTELFTTLEPCTKRKSPNKLPCALRVVQAGGIERVWIGMYDPNPDVYREGWRLLREAGIALGDFTPELRAELVAANSRFLDGFRYSIREEHRQGEPFWVAHKANDGSFSVETPGHTFATRWTARSATSIYALDYKHNVALAKHAKGFEDIDDPSALAFDNYTVAVSEGEIVVFRDGRRGYLLVQVLDVHAQDRGAEVDKLGIYWQARSASPAP